MRVIAGSAKGHRLKGPPSTATRPMADKIKGALFSMLASLGVEFDRVLDLYAGTGSIGEVLRPDEPIDLDVGVDLGGRLTLAVSSPDGLLTLTKPDLLTLTVDSVGFTAGPSGFVVALSGSVRPLIGDLDWPTVTIRQLTIDSAGTVHLDGGWLDLPDQYTLDFHGFSLEITSPRRHATPSAPPGPG